MNTIWLSIASTGCVYYTYTGIVLGKNFTEVTSIAPCLTVTMLALLKSYFHLNCEDYVQELLTNLRQFEINHYERPMSKEKDNIIMEERKFLNAVINALLILNCALVIVFAVTPLVLIAVKYNQTRELELMLPYLDIFAFLPYDGRIWAFAYIYQVWSECVVLLELGAADSLYFTCSTYITIHFRLLHYDIQNSLIERNHLCAGSNARKAVLETLRDLIERHQELIKTANILEVIYSKSTLVNFITSSMVICLSGFIVTSVNDAGMILRFLTFLFMSVMQVYFICFFADMLKGAVLSSAWSYFALLQTMYDK